jgi:hypothetical protein
MQTKYFWKIPIITKKKRPNEVSKREMFRTWIFIHQAWSPSPQQQPGYQRIQKFSKQAGMGKKNNAKFTLDPTNPPKKKEEKNWEEESLTWRWLFKWYSVRPLIPITRITDLGVASAHPMFFFMRERERESVCVCVCERERGRWECDENLEKGFEKEVNLLSAPPSCVTASTKRSWSCGVHRNRGLGSADEEEEFIPDASEADDIRLPA